MHGGQPETGALAYRFGREEWFEDVGRHVSMATPGGRAAVAEVELSAAGRQAVQTGLRQIDRLTAELDPLRCQLNLLSRQPGCRALRSTQFGVGAVTSVAIWAELGDLRRFPNSDNAVRHTGLDITVDSSDTKRSAGHLSRQGPASYASGIDDRSERDRDDRCGRRPELLQIVPVRGSPHQ